MAEHLQIAGVALGDDQLVTERDLARRRVASGGADPGLRQCAALVVAAIAIMRR